MNIPILFAAVLAVATIASSCTAPRSTSHTPAQLHHADDAVRTRSYMHTNAQGGIVAPTGGAHKLQQYATLHVETPSPEAFHNNVRARVEQYDGYVLDASGNHTTVRVNTDRANAFIDAIGTLCTITEREYHSTDVTEEHFDITTRPNRYPQDHSGISS